MRRNVTTAREKTFALAAGSYGEILFDPTTGDVLGFGWQQASYPRGHYDDIARFDVREWEQFYHSTLLSGDWVDILDIGFWFERTDGEHEYASAQCRPNLIKRK